MGLPAELQLALRLFSNTTFSLHQLSSVPLPAAYTGPGLALQVMPSPLGPPFPVLHGQQQLEQPMQQQLHYYTVTPTAQLRTDLLPLLTSYCMTRVQEQHRAIRQQLPEIPASQSLQRTAGPTVVEAAGAQDHVPFLTNREEVTGGVGLESMEQCIQHMCTLLATSVVPAPDLTAAELQAAAAAIAGADRAKTYQGTNVAYRCVLYAPEAVMQTSTRVVPLCETLLRNAATLCEKAARLHDNTGAAAAATKQAITLGVEDAEQHLQWLMRVFGTLVGHKVIGSLPGTAHRPSALALAALSAGPRSDLQRQLFRLTMHHGQAWQCTRSQHGHRRHPDC